MIPYQYPPSDHHEEGRRRWRDGRRLIKSAWVALFTALAQMLGAAVCGFWIWLIFTGPPAETTLGSLVKFVFFLAFIAAAWQCISWALLNIGSFLHDRSLGRYLLEKKPGTLRQGLLVGLVVAVVTVYFNQHPGQLDILLAQGRQWLKRS